MAQQLGLAAPTGVEVAEARGRLTWSSDGNYQAGLTLMTAIGQGNTAVTPLQLAAYAATLANYGQRPALHYADRAVSAATGETLWQYTLQKRAVRSWLTLYLAAATMSTRCSSGTRPPTTRRSPWPSCWNTVGAGPTPRPSCGRCWTPCSGYETFPFFRSPSPFLVHFIHICASKSIPYRDFLQKEGVLF